jgi:hypothetical protein
MSRPQVLQGLLGKCCLLPLKLGLFGMLRSASSEAIDAAGQFEIFVCQASHIMGPNAHV